MGIMKYALLMAGLIPDDEDNCPDTPNEDQADLDGLERMPLPTYLQSLVKAYLAIPTDGECYIIGGWARMVFSLLIGGKFGGEKANDIDLLVIRGEKPSGIEDDCQSNTSLARHFQMADLTVNQVAISTSWIWFTQEAMADHLDGRIRIPDTSTDAWGGDPSPRVYHRAARFAARYGVRFPFPQGLYYLGWSGVLQGWKALQGGEEIFISYLDLLGSTLEDFREEVKVSKLQEREEFLASLDQLSPRKL